MSRLIILISLVIITTCSSLAQSVYHLSKTKRVSPAVVRLGPSTTFMRNGLSRQEVVKLLGEPFSTVETMDGNAVVTTCVFHRSGDRILIAQFRDDVLIASRLQTSGVLAQTRLSS
jgi:hypothetical protein